MHYENMVASTYKSTPRWVHRLFFITMAAFLTAGLMLKLWGELSIVALCGVAIIYCFFTRPPIMPSLAIFSSIGLIYIGLSYSDILPNAWTKFYSQEYILRQSYFVFMLYPIVLGSMVSWRYAMQRMIIDRNIMIFLLFLLGIGPLLTMALMPLEELAPTHRQFGIQQYFFYGLGNREMVVWLAVTYLPIVRYTKTRLISLPLLAAFIFFSSQSTQIALMAPALLIIGFVPIKLLRPALVGMIITVAAASFYSLYRISQGDLDLHDANTILRALYWNEAWQGFWSSKMIGIGFGKEITSQDYPLLLANLPRASLHESMVNGIHNSFISMFFRMGMAGGLVFMWFFFVTCLPSTNGIHPNIARHAAIVYFACFMSNFVNVGVESPRMLIGNAFCLGYVLACKALASKSFYEYRKVPRLAGNVSCATSVTGTSSYAPEGGRPLQRDAL